MHVLVCLREVPDIQGRFLVAQDGRSYTADGFVSYSMSSLDEYALEAALLIKDNRSDTLIDVITVGLRRSEQILRRALGMGADNAILCEEQELPLYDSSAYIAHVIASYVTAKEYRLVLLGAASDDMMRGEVGPMSAAILGWPCATNVVAIEHVTETQAIILRESRKGFQSRIGMELPALITLLSSGNKPRYPSLSNMLRARKTAPVIFQPDVNSTPKPKVNVSGYECPTSRRDGRMLSGTIDEKASCLANILAQRGLI